MKEQEQDFYPDADERRDAVVRRMLATPPQPKTTAPKSPAGKRGRPKTKRPAK